MMTNKYFNHFFKFLIVIAVLNCACQNQNDFDYELGVVAGFSELINAGVKQLALSSPMPPEQMDHFVEKAREVAAKHDVLVFREAELVVTDLFPADIAKGQDVLLLYQGTTKKEYLTLKEEWLALDSNSQDNQPSRIALSRRFGRMLSYSPRKINQLLAQNTSFRTMDDFGIRASNVFLYYEDVEKATTFYSELLGLEVLARYDNANIIRIAADSYLILVDAAKGMHSASEPKTVALALLTDQLDEWYDYLKEKNVTIKYDFKPKDGSAHDGFVAVDTEGYLLEFERFNQHPENERFIPLLEENPTIPGKSENLPQGLGFHSSITWLYYKDVLGMQGFFENVLGLELVADQGWTKIYKVSDTGFIGLVDERRGMHQFTEDKAVTVSFILDDLDGWFSYVAEHKPFELRSEKVNAGPENKYRAFVGYDPEGYFLEFDTFYPHEENEKLMKYLEQ